MRKALLLAGGFGTRLRPLTNKIPKCLVSICGKPLLEHWFDLIFSNSFDRALVNTHWLHEVVEAHIEISPWADRLDQIYEPNLLGTGGTIKANRAYFADLPFMVAHADNLTNFDVEALWAAHLARPDECEITMLTFRTDAPQTCGIVELDHKNRVLNFHEKVENPPGNLANAAVYVLEPSVADYIASLDPIEIDFSTEILPKYMGRILAVETAGYLRDIGSPESLAKAEKEFVSL